MYSSFAIDDLSIKRLTIMGQRIQSLDLGALVVSDASYNVGIGVNAPQLRLDISGTNGIRIPSGTTAQQPVIGVGGITDLNGVLRYNLDDSKFEGYVNGAWSGLGGGAVGDTIDTVTLNANTLNAGAISSGEIMLSGTIGRTAHNTGCLVGKAILGAIGSKTSPIYCIGTNYLPTSTDLNNMYGIGYAHGSTSFLTGGWGMYVAADGQANVFLSSDGDSYFDGGNVGIGTKTPTEALDVTGNIKATGEIKAGGNIIAYQISDRRLKENITPIGKPLEKLKKINGYMFDWIENKDIHSSTGKDIGVIAQEIEFILPEVTTTRVNGYKAVKYDKIVPFLISCIKEQQTQLDNLNELVKSLIKK